MIEYDCGDGDIDTVEFKGVNKAVENALKFIDSIRDEVMKSANADPAEFRQNVKKCNRLFLSRYRHIIPRF